jgi:hypothetical protein
VKDFAAPRDSANWNGAKFCSGGKLSRNLQENICPVRGCLLFCAALNSNSNLRMGSIKKRRKSKINRHKRKKRMKLNRHKKRLRYKS